MEYANVRNRQKAKCKLDVEVEHKFQVITESQDMNKLAINDSQAVVKSILGTANKSSSDLSRDKSAFELDPAVSTAHNLVNSQANLSEGIISTT